MNLTIIVSNDDSQSEAVWKILKDCEFFNEALIKKPVVLSERFYKTIPIIHPNKRYVVVSSNLNPEDKNIIVFKNNEQLLKRLEMLSEEFTIVSDKKMYEYFLPYAKKVYLIELKNPNQKEMFELPNFEQKEEYENESYKMKVYRKVR